MELALPAAFLIGFLSGFKHAFDPDHVVAVSTLIHREPRLSRALRLGLAWGAGHTVTLMGAALVVGQLRLEFSAEVASYLEIPVAVMLLWLGGWTLSTSIRRLLHLRRHTHDGVPHYHIDPQPHPHAFPAWRGFSVGLVHGVAGSAALLLLVAATLPTLATTILYAFVFGTGSIFGMVVVSSAIAIPLLAARSRPSLYEMMTGLAGVLSIGIGVFMVVGFLK